MNTANGAVKARRLFFALWPDDAVRIRIAAVQRDLRTPHCRPVPVPNLHLTLAFLGGQPEVVRMEVERVAAAVRVPAFTVVLDSAGYWPGPGIQWLAPATPCAALLHMHGALASALRAAGVEPDARPYAPHVTLARRARGPVAATGFEPVIWPVQRFALIESFSGPAGSRYEPLACWDLLRCPPTPPAVYVQ
ncbi:MAG: RNA 2',3'-cyclic phosphodiesterase [Gammaproteobacteria bacterium]